MLGGVFLLRTGCITKGFYMHAVYVVQNGNKVKIGRASNPHRRIRAIQTQGGFNAERTYHTDLYPFGGKAERQCHKRLKEFRCVGEWFEMDFDEAVLVVDKVIKEMHDSFDYEEHQAKSNQAGEFLTTLVRSAFGLDDNEHIAYLRSLEWSMEALAFISKLPIDDQKGIANKSSECGCLIIICGDKIHECTYGGAYQVCDKDKYIKEYDKAFIADDLGIDVSDVCDWDDFSYEITIPINACSS